MEEREGYFQRPPLRHTRGGWLSTPEQLGTPQQKAPLNRARTATTLWDGTNYLRHDSIAQVRQSILVGAPVTQPQHPQQPRHADNLSR
jgi:hypothetical protein